MCLSQRTYQHEWTARWTARSASVANFEGVIRIEQEKIRSHAGEVVRETFEPTLNGLLQAWSARAIRSARPSCGGFAGYWPRFRTNRRSYFRTRSTCI